MADTDFEMSREKRQSCSRHGLHQLLLRYWMLFAVLATAGIAVAYPDPGVQLYTHVGVAASRWTLLFPRFHAQARKLEAGTSPPCSSCTFVVTNILFSCNTVVILCHRLPMEVGK